MNSKSTVQDTSKDNVSPSAERVAKDRAGNGGMNVGDASLDEAPAGAGSILKALRILENIVDNPGPVSVAQLATALNFSKPTTHRISNFLEEFGFLEREAGGRRFIESQRLIDLALKVLLAAAQRPNRRGILNWVVEKTGETCNFGIMHRGELVYLDRVESEWPLGLRFEPGSRVPIHCTAMGKMFLSTLSESALNSLLKTIRLTKYTNSTIVSEAVLRGKLAEIRQAGISIDDQEFMYGVVCIAVPVFDPSGEVCACVAISAPEARMSAEQALEHAPLLRAAAAKMQAAMFTPVESTVGGRRGKAGGLLNIG